MEEKYLKGNKLIAEFRFPNAIEEYNSGSIDVEGGILHVGTLIFGQFELMRYHSSWDWLMPVVQKIEDLGYWVEIRDVFCTISNNRVGIKYLKDDISTHKKSKIEATWFTVVEFIKWYNKNK